MSRLVIHHDVGGGSSIGMVVLPRCGTFAPRHGLVRATGDEAKVTCLICKRMIYAASITLGKANRS